MIIDTRNYVLKHNLKRIELNPREQNIILLLSDNRNHNVREIRKYIKLITDMGTHIAIKRLNQKIVNETRLKLIMKNKDNYRIYKDVYIGG